MKFGDNRILNPRFVIGFTKTETKWEINNNYFIKVILTKEGKEAIPSDDTIIFSHEMYGDAAKKLRDSLFNDLNKSLDELYIQQKSE